MTLVVLANNYKYRHFKNQDKNRAREKIKRKPNSVKMLNLINTNPLSV